MGRDRSKQRQGFCVFCGGPRLSKEHVFAEWLQRYLPLRSASTSHAGSVGAPANQLPPELASVVPTPHHRITHRPGDPLTRRHRVVCRKCNGGWMSQLQQKARPLLVPLLRAVWRVDLREPQLATLAAWCAMTTMIMEYAHEPTRVIPEADRKHLMATKRAPGGWAVWFGRYHGKKWTSFNHLTWWIQHLNEETNETTVSQSQATAWCLGPLFIQTYSTTAPVRRVDPASFAEERGLAVVWPPPGSQPFEMPARILDDLGADDVGRALVPGDHGQLRRQWELEPPKLS